MYYWTINKTILLLGILAIIFMVLFYRPNENIQESSSQKDFLQVQNAPQHIVSLFQKSCYDCHSNFTNYRWFHHIPPLSWYIDKHIENGKNGLNFSNWGSTSNYEEIIYKRSMRTASIFDIESDRMPPSVYLRINPDKKLSNEEKKKMVIWLYSLGFE